ncbi:MULTISPECIES: NADP-dependent oxidoreductase [Streptomyces]|uniref:NADP-dependent oxidoreductase n=1 Tax=Streptomyces edwardsiae TaxID=3075527 RepID=A0ABU2PPU5_9ACTN|nr:NADP-dependent oxidoreductase [Streptomyces sp. DSM 41636]MDT0393753.1 NADP-dependent oxidoreductase [Streptomyces sp. DSM 41636]
MGTPSFRAAVVRVPNGPDSIEVIHVPVVDPGPGQIRVAIAAATVNPTDIGVAAGFFHSMGLVNQPEHTGLGWEFAGVVDASGPGVDLTVGTRVAGLVVGFDRDHGTYAEQIVVAAADVVPVPDELDLLAAATVPLNGLAAAQAVDLLGDAPAGAARLLVTGAAGAVGGNVSVLARERGWQVTGLARAGDEEFVRGLGADFTTRAEPEWDAVVDPAQLNGEALKLIRDGGAYVGLRPGMEPPIERGISVASVITAFDSTRLADLLARASAGELPARVHAVVPLHQAAEAHRATATSGLRGRYVICP